MARLAGFHLANGTVSLVGNLLLVRVLTGAFGWPVMIADAGAIGVCSVVNFLLSDRWVFRSAEFVEQRPFAAQKQCGSGR